jgi:uncharacterized protein
MLIFLYQKLISPLTHFLTSTLTGNTNACRFTPTCSEYFQLAVKKYGIIRGGILGIKRIFRCHPWSKASIFDPIP